MSNVIAISTFRSNLPDLVKKVSSGFERIFISIKGEPKAVLISQDELESLEETAEVLMISGAKESIKRGLKETKLRKGINISNLD